MGSQYSTRVCCLFPMVASATLAANDPTPVDFNSGSGRVCRRFQLLLGRTGTGIAISCSRRLRPISLPGTVAWR